MFRLLLSFSPLYISDSTQPLSLYSAELYRKKEKKKKSRSEAPQTLFRLLSIVIHWCFIAARTRQFVFNVSGQQQKKKRRNCELISAAFGTMAANVLQMKLSQDSLFFPLPFTNATIDNVVQVQNPLPTVQGNPKANAVSFKILSEVPYRYSVRPPVGFIGAGDHVTIIFSFNPEQVKAAKNPAERELPTETTKDAIHIDFAVVEAPAASTALAHWVPGSKEAKLSREVQADASAFWKQRGQVTKNTATMMRFKLRCVFATRNNVPDSLVISMKEEEEEKNAETRNAAVPKTRPLPTSTTDPRNTAPPEAPPHRHSEAAAEPSHTARAATAAAAAAAAPPLPPPAAAAATARSMPPIAPPPATKLAVKLPSSSSTDETTKQKNGFVSAVMNYRLPYALVAILLVLTLLCGLLDHGNLLTWLMSKRRSLE